MTYKVHIQNVSVTKKIPSKTQFQSWVNAAFYSRITSAEITIRIVDEAESAQLNWVYRNKKGPTNILSFPYQSTDHAKDSLSGDMIICAAIVLSEAKTQHKTIIGHWAHLVVHGALHLLGYDHLSEEEAIMMESLEIKILNSLGYTNPYEI